MFRIEASSWCISPLMIVECSFFLNWFLFDVYFVDSYNSLLLKSVWLENLFLTFYSEVMYFFDIEVCFLNVAEGWVLFSYHFVTLCLFIGELIPMTLRDINDQWLLILLFLVFVVVLVCVYFPFLDVAGVRLSIICVSLSVINFTVLVFSF